MDCTKVRDPPIVTKLDSKKLDLIFYNRSIHELIEIFQKNNYELRIAGGAVRYTPFFFFFL